MLRVFQSINTPVTSNCYVLYDKYSKECIIVDPGSKDETELFGYLEQYDLEPRYIILTHEHFDHCSGVNALVERYGIPIVCSQVCAEAIKYEKRNCSVYYDNQEAFTINCETISTESIGNTLSFDGESIRFFNTPGHTDASICFVVSGYLFTGDTLIKDEKTVTKLPTGSVEKLKESKSMINQLRGKGLLVYPGHGEGFALDEYDLSKCWEGKTNEEHSYI